MNKRRDFYKAIARPCQFSNLVMARVAFSGGWNTGGPQGAVSIVGIALVFVELFVVMPALRVRVQQ